MTRAISQLSIEPCRAPLCGSVPVFDDQAILLARLALAAVCRGRSKLDLWQAPGAAAQSFLRALELLGFETKAQPAGRAGWELEVVGRGLSARLDEPGVLDVRGACEVGGLLVGLLAGRPGRYELLVDDRVADAVVPFLAPLGALTAEPSEGASLLRLQWPEGARLDGFALEASGHFSWLKQAALLCGLRAAGETTILESVTSADHLERALLRARAPLQRAGSLLTLHPPRDADALAPDHFGPIGSAHALAYLAALALAVPGSKIEARAVSTNPSGPDVASLVRALGGGVSVRPAGDVQGEPFGDVTFFGRLGRGDASSRLALAGESAIRLGDGLFPFLFAAARGVGHFEFPELVAHGQGGDAQVIARVLGYLQSAGVELDFGAGIGVRGRGATALSPLRVTTGGDGRLAALGTLMAMVSAEPSVIDDVDCLRSEFPRLVGTLKALGAQIEVGSV